MQHYLQCILTFLVFFNILVFVCFCVIPGNKNFGCAVTSLLASELIKEDALGAKKTRRGLKKDEDVEVTEETLDETTKGASSRQS